MSCDASSPAVPLDEQLANHLFERYVVRLVGLARTQLSNQVATRVDPEDVVQSAMRSFFRRAQRGKYQWDGERELWYLLARITVRKVITVERRHRAHCRDVAAEHGPASGDGPRKEPTDRCLFLAREPDPCQAHAAIDELRRVLDGLPPLYGRVVELRLQGHSTEQVAALSGCSERTVFRASQRCRALLERRFYAAEN